MQIKRILTWPHTPENNINPWHIMLHRLLCFPFVYIGMVVVWFGVLLGWGYCEANEAWDRVL